MTDKLRPETDFLEWLRQYEGKDNVAGDFADDTAGCVKLSKGTSSPRYRMPKRIFDYETLAGYLRSRGACDEAVKVANTLYIEWRFWIARQKLRLR